MAIDPSIALSVKPVQIDSPMNQMAQMYQLQGAQQSAASQIGYAGSPQDLFSKYASVVFGTPQASTTANFTGTQGGTSQGSSKSMGGSLTK